MRKLSYLFMITLVVFISGCSNNELKENEEVIEKHFIYTGENELWSAEYQLDAEMVFTKEEGRLKVDCYKEILMTVTYKEDLSTLSQVREIIINCNSLNKNMSLTQEYDENECPTNNTFTLKSRGSSATYEDQNTVIDVTITVDGKEQKFELLYQE